MTRSCVPDRVLDPEDIELLLRAEKWCPEATLTALSVAKLGELSRTEGIGFATAVLHDRILRAPANAEFAQSLGASSTVNTHKALLGIVPGAFYRQHNHTGADGKRIVEIARKLSIDAELLPVESFGALTQNAKIISEWLTARRSQPVVLVSLSKGSSDVKQALARQDAEACFENVRAWISYSGIVQGTALVAWLKSKPLRHFGVRLLLRLQGHKFSTLDELRWGNGAPLSDWPVLPEGLRAVHIYGFPLERHLRHPWAFRGYDRLRSLGPNDGGGVLLGDLTQLPGIVLPVWGADHYLSPAWDLNSMLEKVVLAAVQLSEPLHATRSETKPRRAPATKSQT